MKPPKVLIADDSPASRELLSTILAQLGCDVELAENGADAVQGAQLVNPDLIILDIRMPVLDGYEAMRSLRQDPRFSTLPIIALTAHAMDGDREKGLAAGFTEYVTKPVGPRKFRELLAKYLKQDDA